MYKKKAVKNTRKRSIDGAWGKRHTSPAKGTRTRSFKWHWWKHKSAIHVVENDFESGCWPVKARGVNHIANERSPSIFCRKTHVRPKPRHRSANQGCHNRTRDEAGCKLKYKMNQGSKDVRYQKQLLNRHLLSNGRTAIIGTNAIAKGEGSSTAATSARWSESCSTVSQSTGLHCGGCLLKSKEGTGKGAGSCSK